MKHTMRGFTIVELLIVIVVIAILAALSIVAYNGIQTRAHTSAVQSDLRQITQAIEIDKIEGSSGLYIGRSTIARLVNFARGLIKGISV